MRINDAERGSEVQRWSLFRRHLRIETPACSEGHAVKNVYLAYVIQAIGIGEEKLVLFYGRDIRGIYHVKLTS